VTETSARAALFRKAALAIERGETCSCCPAIVNSTANVRQRQIMEARFQAYFMPKDHGLFWWGGACVCGRPDTEGARVLALCFMAAIEERP
jgi:hypothetical protein